MDLHGVPRARAVGVDDGTRLHVAGCDVEVMHTPGHTRGSTCLRVHGTARPLMCTGDVLERHTAARCDLVGGGSAVTQERSMASRIAVLDDDVVLLPGHGEVTTIGEERRRGMLTSAPA
jgi:hydroxyacylglutathione hydrolase